ncbi:YdjY domain-containing protein [Cerasicoccus arenae]|uniref:Uncharacterized protein n=1 Tax=Cerasicoccus arenae TaxID=424488 RepID=A0A8J3DJT0_9BACT|nr:YdjY domain-containing protein [Cerasicoccus arenae]MBK1859877.1 hypothetical protein [Cerasicoccus arenae]GHC01408.1 hypothetical protein GCM10007047_17340 [Cerasicoccus arenae]
MLTLVPITRGEEPPPLEWRPAIKPEVKQLEDGRLDVGGVIVDPDRRTATLPVRLNQSNDGEQIEYLLVHENGKTHESLLKTSIQPFHLHTAMLLLGVSRAAAQHAVAPPENIDDEYLALAPSPLGPGVSIAIIAGEERIPVETWVWDEARQSAMLPANWVYTGSYFQGVNFIAEVDGSFASLITDPASLINSGDPRRTVDDNWYINAQASSLPKADETVLLEIALLPEPVDASADALKLSPEKLTHPAQ